VCGLDGRLYGRRYRIVVLVDEMQSLPLHARKTPTKDGQETDYSTTISTALFRGLRSDVEMITWATTEFTQIRWKRHFDMKLWVGSLYPRISSTP
jgi:hypothetical protein